MSDAHEQLEEAIDRLLLVDDIPKVFLKSILRESEHLKDVTQGERWCKRFCDLTRRVASVENWDRQVEDHVFELKVISFISDVLGPASWKLEYESQPTHGVKNVDLKLDINGRSYLIEVKCVHPPFWSEKGTATSTLDRPIIPNEINDVTVRSRKRLIERVSDAEAKMASYEIDESLKILAISVNAQLRVFELETFAQYYYTGEFSLEDELADQTRRYVKDQGIAFAHSLDAFWSFRYQSNLSIELRDAPRTFGPDGSGGRLHELLLASTRE